MNQDRKSGYISILRNKKVLIATVASLVVALTLSASAFVEDNTAAKKYEKNQAAGSANSCGNEELPLNVLCNNMASEVQGDENAIGLSSAQKGGSLEQPYENLVEEISTESTQHDEWNLISDRQDFVSSASP
jgi:hypothetical protein